ncbi:MAG: ketopantoate reductase family protein [Lachnospiraceae bacterium]|jgi:2-dehydropantoate 2-reductase
MKFKKVAILGAGAVGSYILWGLSQKPDIDLCVVAAGERKRRYEEQGFTINDIIHRPAVKTPQEAHGADLIIVSTKYNSLQDSLKDIEAVCGEHTTVMSLMNGIDSEDIIGARVGMEKIVPSVIRVASERRDNCVRFNPDSTGVIYGETNPSRPKDRMKAMGEMFAGSGVKYRESAVIMSEIWSKFRMNIGDNLVQAILGVGVGAYKDSEHAGSLRKKLGAEVEALADAQGIDISLSVKPSGAVGSVPKRTRFSTLQDLDAGRPTEIEMFSGTIVRLGKELGVPTPYNEFAYHIIKAMEEKNAGRFDYD